VTYLDLQSVAHLLTALFLGLVIGLERQWRQRLAGLRTNALVSTGAALFVVLSQRVSASGDLHMAAQVVSGIGFLGAGVIMREGVSVRGLNTAATLWCSAAVGATAGYGFAYVALFGALSVLGTNIFLRPLAQRINRRPANLNDVDFKYRIRIVCRESDESHVRYLLLQVITSTPLILRAMHSQDIGTSGRIEVKAEVESPANNVSLLEQIVNRLSLEKGVSAVSWKISSEQYDDEIARAGVESPAHEGTLAGESK